MRFLAVLFIAILATGCIHSNMKDISPDGAKTIRNVTSFNILGKIDKEAHEFTGEWDGQGGVKLTTGEAIEGFDMTNQSVLVDMLGQVLAKAIDAYIQGLLTRPPTPLEVLPDVLEGLNNAPGQ